MTKGMLTRFKKITGKGTGIIATGGYAPLLRSHIRTIHSTELHLVMEGVRLLYEANKNWK